MNDTTLAVFNILYSDIAIINRLSLIRRTNNCCPLNRQDYDEIERQIESHFVVRLTSVSRSLRSFYDAVRDEIDWRSIAELMTNRANNRRQYTSNRPIIAYLSPNKPSETSDM
jgi:hypothetical protein